MNLFEIAKRALLLLLIFTVLTGIAYPLVVTGVARLAFPGNSRGSLIGSGASIVGSELIGQRFDSEKYFHGRPSAAGADGYDAGASSGSNLGPTNARLIETVEDNAKDLRQENNLPPGSPVPSDLVTASASGLDPHVSPDAAYLQVPRVARARGISETELRALVENNVEGRLLGVFGESRVNVLKLNLELDKL